MPTPFVIIVIVTRNHTPEQECCNRAKKEREYAQARGIRAVTATASSPHTVDHARNRGVGGAMLSETDWTHILMLDDDVLIPEDTLVALMGVDADVVGGCYPGIKKIVRGIHSSGPQGAYSIKR